MPPPALPHSGSNARGMDTYSAGARSPSPATARPLNKAKNAGFKPIGQPNASLKRFFPGDDESESEQQQQQTSPSTILATQTSNMSMSHSQSISSRSQDLASVELSVRSHPNGAHIHASRLELHSGHRLGPIHDTRHFTPARATPSPAAHHPPAHFHMEEQRMMTNGAMQMRPMDYDPSLPMQHTPSQLQQQEHTPNMTRPPTPIRNEEFYAIVNQVGEGTFGKVYKARNTASGKFVALKRIRMETERDGFPVTAMREIKLLQSLRHDNVVQLYEMMVSNGEFITIRPISISLWKCRSPRIRLHGLRVYGSRSHGYPLADPVYVQRRPPQVLVPTNACRPRIPAP